MIHLTTYLRNPFTDVHIINDRMVDCIEDSIMKQNSPNTIGQYTNSINPLPGAVQPVRAKLTSISTDVATRKEDVYNADQVMEDFLKNVRLKGGYAQNKYANNHGVYLEFYPFD